jgi:hypothetical protein
MSETRRLKMKIGDAEFEADVPESKVEPMYDRFLSMLERRRTPLSWQLDTAGTAHKTAPETEEAVRGSIEEVVRSSATKVCRETCDQNVLTQVFDLRQDGVVILKVLPKSPDQHADALLLLLYGYYCVKNEERVMATVLNRAAELSGIPLRRLANAYGRNGRYVARCGYGKGSNYSLNSEGLVIAKEIVANIFELGESAAPHLSEDAGRYREGAIVGDVSPVEHHSPLFQ